MAGWNHWRSVGFDMALMQSVYAFTFAHHGDMRRNRLAVTATNARRYGLGAEIECGDIVTEPKDRYYFRCYLADGAANHLGYQQAATAYYLGDDLVEQMLASPVPEVRSLYDALADYTTGRTVPDPPTRWTSPQTANLTNDLLSPGRPVQTAQTHFSTPKTISRVDLFLEAADVTQAWTRTAQIEVLLPGSMDWSPGGWALRTSPDAAAGAWQALTVPVGQTVAGLRVTCQPMQGTKLPVVRAIAPEYGDGANTHFHLAQYKPYQILPAPPATYPDEGRKLVDGVIADKNFLDGKSVGRLWTDAAIQFDLGRVRNVSGLEVHCQGGGEGAVNWPAFACAALSTTDMPPDAQTGRGPPPTPNTDPKAWADDGHRLTDGVIASQGESGQISGWDTGDWRDVAIDLGYAQPIRAVTTWDWAAGAGMGHAQRGRRRIVFYSF